MSLEKNMSYSALLLPDKANLTDDEMLIKATAFYQKMKKRHSVRDFSDRDVSRDVIEDCIRAAGTAPSGANQQPWHFVAISKPEAKHRIRLAAEEEEQKFYEGGGGDAWIKALEPIGTNADKPHLDVAPWLIVVFAQRWGQYENGEKYKHYYVPESVGIATGILLTALHNAGMVSLTHTPNPMKFLNGMLSRPEAEKPIMIIAVGHPAKSATVPRVAKIKKPIDEILTIIE